MIILKITLKFHSLHRKSNILALVNKENKILPFWEAIFNWPGSNSENGNHFSFPVEFKEPCSQSIKNKGSKSQ